MMIFGYMMARNVVGNLNLWFSREEPEAMLSLFAWEIRRMSGRADTGLRV